MVLGLVSTSCSSQKVRVRNFFIEIDGSGRWPADLKNQFKDALGELSEGCWQTTIEGKATTETVMDDHWCSNFEAYTAEEQLKPYSKTKEKIKLKFSPHQRKDGKNSILVKGFAWDGKKVYRVLNSGSELHKLKAKDFIVLWSQK